MEFKAFFLANKRILLAAGISLLSGVALGAAILAVVLGNAGRKGQGPDAAITQSTLVTEQLHFTRCGHVLENQKNPSAYAGMTRARFAALFPEDTIASFSTESVVLARDVDGFCCNHYVLILDEVKGLQVQRANAETLEMDPIQLIQEEAITDASAKKELLQGIAFSSMAEIDTYLESTGS